MLSSFKLFVVILILNPLTVPGCAQLVKLTFVVNCSKVVLRIQNETNPVYVHLNIPVANC